MTTAAKKLTRTVSKPLTTKAIAAMKPGQILADGGIDTGVGRLKIRKRQTKTGSVSEWLYIYWGGEKGKRVTILLNGKGSRYSPKEQEGFLTIPQARELARKLQADVQAGVDPAMQRELDKSTTQKAQVTAISKLKDSKEKTLAALMAAYVSSLESKGKSKSAYDVANLVKNHISKPFPTLASTPAAQITALDVSKILTRLVGPDVVTKKGRTATKLRSYMAAAYTLAMGAELDPMAPGGAAGFDLKVNPAAAVPATKMSAAFHKKGERTLTISELRCYMTRLESIPSEIQRLALELQIMAGGQRMQQLLRLTRADLTEDTSDPTKDTFTLFDPKGKRAQPRTHILPLLAELRERIERLKILSPVSDRNLNGSLFASTGGSVINAETLSGVVLQISRAMVAAKESVIPFRGGDIRRTCETMISGTLGISKDTRAQVLSHGLSGVQDTVYDKGKHLDSKIAALRAWIDYLLEVRQGLEKPISVSKK